MTESGDKKVRLDLFTNPEFSRGASRATELGWIILSGLLVESWLPGSAWRRLLLRIFGARIGTGVVIKPRVRVKFPWCLEVGENAWIGEAVWIDNLDRVTIGANACLSQGAFLCTGSHDWTKESFDLITKSIQIGEGAWVGAHSIVAPGSTIGEGTVLTLSSVGMGELASWTIYSGSPARAIKKRLMQAEQG
jgi:putative colanic acid biosynthesis acetyltransferase WcaF